MSGPNRSDDGVDWLPGASLAGTLALLQKGVANPTTVPLFVLEKLFPDSRWGPNWREEDGYVTFEEGGFAAGDATRPEFCSRTYNEVAALDRALGDRRYDRSLEVGSGYGRLSGWIADHADHSVGVDPNADAVKEAGRLYPDLAFGRALAGGLPFPADGFDLVVSWMVLTHVPPGQLQPAVEDVLRVARPDARIVLLERTSGARGRVSWPRSRDRYESLFEPFRVVERADRPTEPTFDAGDGKELLVLER